MTEASQVLHGGKDPPFVKSWHLLFQNDMQAVQLNLDHHPKSAVYIGYNMFWIYMQIICSFEPVRNEKQNPQCVSSFHKTTLEQKSFSYRSMGSYMNTELSVEQFLLFQRFLYFFVFPLSDLKSALRQIKFWWQLVGCLVNVNQILSNRDESRLLMIVYESTVLYIISKQLLINTSSRHRETSFIWSHISS